MGGSTAQSTARAMVGESPPGCVCGGGRGGAGGWTPWKEEGQRKGRPGANPADPSQAAPQGPWLLFPPVPDLSLKPWPCPSPPSSDSQGCVSGQIQPFRPVGGFLPPPPVHLLSPMFRPYRVGTLGSTWPQAVSVPGTWGAGDPGRGRPCSDSLVSTLLEPIWPVGSCHGFSPESPLTGGSPAVLGRMSTGPSGPGLRSACGEDPGGGEGPGPRPALRDRLLSSLVRAFRLFAEKWRAERGPGEPCPASCPSGDGYRPAQAQAVGLARPFFLASCSVWGGTSLLQTNVFVHRQSSPARLKGI